MHNDDDAEVTFVYVRLLGHSDFLEPIELDGHWEADDINGGVYEVAKPIAREYGHDWVISDVQVSHYRT